MSDLVMIADRVLNRPLLLTRDKAQVILSVLAGRIGVQAPEASRFEGDDVRYDENGRPVRGAYGEVKRKPYRVAEGSVGIVTITGSLVARGAWLNANSGLTSYEGIQHQIKALKNADEVETAIVDIHSPGGEAILAFETAAIVRELAAIKRTVAIVNGMACSAAYAIASGASEIVTTETGVSGSIGVVLLHADFSRKLDREGVRPTLIHAGEHKVDGNPFEPLSPDVRNDLQAEVNAFYEAFLKTVAQGRGNRLDIDAARATKARTLIGQAAVDAGLADRVGTFESVLAELSNRGASRSSNATPRGTRMAEKTGAPDANVSGITTEQHNAAVTAARAEGKAEGAKEGASAERDRFKAIVSSPKATGKEKQALALALTGASVEQAEAMLDVAAPDAGASAQPPAGRSKDAPGGMATVDPAVSAQQAPSEAAASAWDKSVERVNSRIG